MCFGSKNKGPQYNYNAAGGADYGAPAAPAAPPKKRDPLPGGDDLMGPQAAPLGASGSQKKKVATFGGY